MQTRIIKRRQFIKGSGLAAAGAGATLMPMPAIAQSAPEIKWRVTSSFPRSLDTLYGTLEVICKAVAEMTDNRFQLEPSPAGEIVPGLEAADAVTKGAVEMAQTASYYYWAKDPAFAIGSCLPFGLNTRSQAAWWFHGGGAEIMADFYGKHNIHALVAGNTGAQMGGFFRKEINTLADMKGLRFRMGGFGARVAAKVGVDASTIAGDQIYAALEKGDLDGTEWVGPYDDEKLGFHKVARFYYYPGWWEGTSMSHLFVNKERWQSLPPAYQRVLEQAALAGYVWQLAKYDAGNPPALRRLVQQGVQLRAFSQDILDACLKAANETYDEMSAQSPDFKRAYDSIKPFRAEQYLWFQLSEYTYDTYMMIQQRKKTI
jgi:TRAP-type mannitol/chloroaromatic compound transport system substrate-binding protein